MKYSASYLWIIFLGLAILLISSCMDDNPCTELTWYEDADGDGFGNPDVSQTSCEQPLGYVSDRSDTNDGETNETNTNPEDENEICEGNGNSFMDIPTELHFFTLKCIFAENFDEQEDFANNIGSPNSNGTAFSSCRSGDELNCEFLPAGWDVYSSGERFHPGIVEDQSTQPGLQINRIEARGGTGKSLMVWDESYGTNSQWGSDALLGKKFFPGYDDIYAEMWIKFQPDYRWQYMETTKGINYAKLLRMSHSDSDPISTGANGPNAPMTILQFKVWCDDFFDGPRTNRVSLAGIVRCDPQESNYQCPGRDFGLTGNISVPGVPGVNGDASFLDTFGDGDWHKIGMRMALNSAPGAEDGKLMIWYNNELISNSSIVTFLEEGAPETHLITTVLLGGNMHNICEPEESQFEQWYAIDDVRIFSVQE